MYLHNGYQHPERVRELDDLHIQESWMHFLFRIAARPLGAMMVFVGLFLTPVVFGAFGDMAAIARAAILVLSFIVMITGIVFIVIGGEMSPDGE